MTKRNEILMRLTPFPLIALFGFSPVLLAMFAGFITSLFGEQLNEGSPPDVPVIGGSLYSMGVMGWFSLITIPLAGLGLIIYLIIFLLKAFEIMKKDFHTEEELKSLETK